MNFFRDCCSRSTRRIVATASRIAYSEAVARFVEQQLAECWNESLGSPTPCCRPRCQQFANFRITESGSESQFRLAVRSGSRSPKFAYSEIARSYPRLAVRPSVSGVRSARRGFRRSAPCNGWHRSPNRERPQLQTILRSADHRRDSVAGGVS